MTRFTSFAALVFFAGLFAGCRTVPGTGRSQIASMVSESQLAAGASAQFAEVKKKPGVSSDPAMNAALRRVGARIVEQARKLDPALPPFAQWDFAVIKDDSANAFAMPGGKVAFNTGIFPLMTSDDEIAVVMGHEVAHVIARHGGERVTHQMIAQGLQTGLAIGVQGSKYADLIMTGYGVGAQYGGILPFSRLHESEADTIGIHLSAKAGYDPQVAIGFWQKMSAGGGAPPEFLSTHPSGATRIADFQKGMALASQEYQAARSAGAPAGEKLSFKK